jgi:hypothetical protein
MRSPPPCFCSQLPLWFRVAHASHVLQHRTMAQWHNAVVRRAKGCQDALESLTGHGHPSSQGWTADAPTPLIPPYVVRYSIILSLPSRFHIALLHNTTAENTRAAGPIASLRSPPLSAISATLWSLPYVRNSPFSSAATVTHASGGATPSPTRRRLACAIRIKQ